MSSCHWCRARASPEPHWRGRGEPGCRPPRLERPVSAHRRAVREQLAHVDALRAELEAEGMATELLDGEQVARLLWARFNPTRADDTRRSAATGNVEVLGELDAAGDRDLARQAAVRLREQIAASSLDFKSSHQHVVVDRDVEQTIVIANTAGRTQMGWLYGAMLTRQPFTLSVFVHGLERRRERQRLKLAYRRLFTINRGAEQRGRVPDFDRYVQEREYRELLGEMATGETSNLFRVSVYQTLRARGPDPDLAATGRSGRLLHGVDRVRGGLQGEPRRVSPARAVVLEPPARARSISPGAEVPDRERRRHAPADRHQVRVADRGAVRVRRPRPHRRADQPLRRGALQPHDRHLRPQREWQDDDRLGAAVALPGVGGARVRDRPRRPLRDPHPATGRGAADRDRRRRLSLRAEPVGRARPSQGLAGEDRVPARAAPGDDGRPGRPAAGTARRR